jgi:hypothetical protein
VLGTLVLGSLAPAAIAQTSLGNHLPCPRKGSQVIAEDKLVRVYRYPPGKDRGLFTARSRSEACLFKRGTRLMLFDSERKHANELPRKTFKVVALAGAMVAYSIGHFGTDSGTTDLFVADVAKRTVRELPGEGFVDAGIRSRSRRTDFLLAPSGSAAWIVEVGGAHIATKFVVYAAPANGIAVVLDEGPGIEPRSLEISAGRLRWNDAGTPKSARLGT